MLSILRNFDAAKILFLLTVGHRMQCYEVESAPIRAIRGETFTSADVEFLFRFDERPEIIYFSTVGGDFGVDKSDNKALLRRWRERMAYPVQIFLNAGHGLLRTKSFQGAKVAFLTIGS
jgi:hypothetical protein